MLLSPVQRKDLLERQLALQDLHQDLPQIIHRLLSQVILQDLHQDLPQVIHRLLEINVVLLEGRDPKITALGLTINLFTQN